MTMTTTTPTPTTATTTRTTRTTSVSGCIRLQAPKDRRHVVVFLLEQPIDLRQWRNVRTTSCNFDKVRIPNQVRQYIKKQKRMQENVVDEKKNNLQRAKTLALYGKMAADGWSICSHLTGQH